MVTILADNYFGYCKKEVKTQIGYSANLFGLAEEEHAGGALAFATFSLGDRFVPDQVRIVSANHRFAEVLRAARATRATCHAVGLRDRQRSIPRSTTCRRTWRSTSTGRTSRWTSDGQEQHLKLLPGRIYIHPSGYKVRMAKHRAAPSWRLVGHGAGGRLLPQAVHRLGRRQVGDQQEPGRRRAATGRSTCGASTRTWRWSRRSSSATTRRASRLARTSATGAPAPVARALARLGDQAAHAQPAEFTPEYNAWLETIPNHVRALVFVIKRFYRPEWGDDWREPLQRRHHQRRARARAQVRRAASWSPATCASGCEANGAWRTFKLRQDFVAADKVQMEDDITASVVVPARRLVGLPERVRRPPEPQAGAELRVPAVPAARRRHPSRLRPADRGGHGAARALLLELPAARPADDAQRIVEDVGAARRVHRADARRTWPGTPRAPTAATRSARRSRGWSTASRPRTRATCRCAPTSPTRATATSPRWARASTAGCRCTQPVLFPVISVLSGRRNNPPERGHPPALRLRPDPLPGAARAVHGLHLLADRQVARAPPARARRARSPRGRSTPCRRPPTSTTPWSPCCSPATAASAPPPATSARATGWTTTSACWSPRSGAACSRTSATRSG